MLVSEAARGENGGMPKRPRQHQLEEESRVAFRSKVPREWVFRDSVPDYGIDGHVEIFDKAAHGTGRLFLVQLKATDAPNLSRALAISFRRDIYQYYRSLDLPVLVVLYHAKSGRLYARWFHAFDPYYSRGGKGTKTFTFRLTEDDEWRAGTAQRLLSDIETIRQLRSPGLRLPISVSVCLPEAPIHGVSSAKLALALRKLGNRHAGLLVLETRPVRRTLAIITISNDEVKTSLAGRWGFTLHTSSGYPSEDVLTRFPSDILLGLAMAFDQAGHSDIGAQLAAAYATTSSIIKHPSLVIRIAGCMARARRVTEAVRLSEVLLENKSSRAAAQTLLIPALLERDSLSTSELEYLRTFMKRLIARFEQDADREDAATAHYNFGNHLRGRATDRQALRHYRLAAKWNPAYRMRAYFWRELAGLLFESGHYRWSAQAYQRARDLGEDKDGKALHADALMLAGDYRAAQDLFQDYLGTTTEPESEWRLKAWALSHIRRTLGLDEQTRERQRAMALVPDKPDGPPEQLRLALMEALAHDALCSVAWLNLGHLELSLDNSNAAFPPFLIAALSLRGDLEAWCLTTGLAMSFTDHQERVQDILRTAYRFHGDSFTERFAELAQEWRADFPVSAFFDMMAQLRPRRSPFEMRLVKGDSTYETVTLRRDEDSEDATDEPGPE